MSPLEQRILQTLAIVSHELSIVSAWPRQQRLIDTALSRMKAQGLIEDLESPENPPCPSYRITDAGRAALRYALDETERLIHS